MKCARTPAISLPRQQASASTSYSTTAGAAPTGQPTGATSATGISPAIPTTSPSGSSPADWVLPFGGHAGKPISQVPATYLAFMIDRNIFGSRAQAEVTRRKEVGLPDADTLRMEIERSREGDD